jgi:hypothetical protein
MLKGEIAMKRLVTWSATLAVAAGLMLCSATQAAVVNVGLSFHDETTGQDITFSGGVQQQTINAGDTLTWQMTAYVGDTNSYTLQANGQTFNLGLESVSLGINSSNAGVVEIPEGSFLGNPTGQPDSSAVTYNTQAPATGFGSQSVSQSKKYTSDGNKGLVENLLALPFRDGSLDTGDYNGSFTDVVAQYQVGRDAPVVFVSGTMSALADGTVTYTPFTSQFNDPTSGDPQYNISTYRMDESTGGIFNHTLSAVPGVNTVNLTPTTLTVGPIPEPATIALLSFGVVGLLKRRRHA